MSYWKANGFMLLGSLSYWRSSSDHNNVKLCGFIHIVSFTSRICFGANFSHLMTPKKSSLTHTKDFVKKKALKSPDIKGFLFF